MPKDRMNRELEEPSMNCVVIYASRSGNTEHVAERIAETLRTRGRSELFEIGDAPTDLTAFELIVIGGPTEGHGITPQMRAYLDRVVAGSVENKPAAVFDTRLAWPRFLSGAASDGISRQLRDMGAHIVLNPESFIVTSKPELQPGELDRAEAWANDVYEAAVQRTPALAELDKTGG